MEVEVSLPWPAGIPQLKRLDELLRCGICYEFMSTSMVTLCSHNYCSLCIRQYLSYKTQCPACFKETTNQHLRNNRLIDEIIMLFPALRDKVARLSQSLKGGSIAGYFETIGTGSDTRKDDEMNAIQTRPPTTTTEVVTPLTSIATPASHSSRVRHEEDVSVASPKPARGLLQSLASEQTILETPKRTIGQEKKLSFYRTLSRGGQMDGPSISSSPSPFLFSPTSSSKLKSPIGSGGGSQSSATHPAHTPSSISSVSGHFSIRTDSPQRGESSEGGGRGAEAGERVSCPVCHVELPQRNINIHLDACLKSVDQGNDVVAIAMHEPKRKALPKLVYSLLNDKQLKQKMREAGLSMLGDRTTLINRHKRYTTLYNAECDVSEPRSAAELVRQVEKEEREKIKAATSIFNYDRKTAPEVIEKEQTAYLKKNNNHFASLIADIKQRQAEKNAKNSMMRWEEEEEGEERKKGGRGNKVSPEKSSKEDIGKKRKGGVRKGQREVLLIEDSDDDDDDGTVRKGRSSNRLRTLDRDEKEFCEVKEKDQEKEGETNN